VEALSRVSLAKVVPVASFLKPDIFSGWHFPVSTGGKGPELGFHLGGIRDRIPDLIILPGG